MMKKPHNPALELRDKIFEATAQQLEGLISHPYFGRAMENIPPESYPEFSKDALHVLLPHIQLNTNTLVEISCWVASSNPNQQDAATVLIEKFIQEQPNFENKIKWIQMAAADKYSFADAHDVENAIAVFAEACQDERNAQQAKRIGQSIEVSASVQNKKAKI